MQMSDKLLLINASIANRAVFKITFKGRRDIQAATTPARRCASPTARRPT